MSEALVAASRCRWSGPIVLSVETEHVEVESEIPMHPRDSRLVREAGARLGGCRVARTLSCRGELVHATAGESEGIIGSHLS